MNTLTPKSFIAGKEYATRSICDHNCIFKFQVTRRTAKSVWITGESINTPERRKIDIYNGEEIIHPIGHYSMAPVLSASDII